MRGREVGRGLGVGYVCEQLLVPSPSPSPRVRAGDGCYDPRPPESGLCVLASQAAPETKGGSLGLDATSGVMRSRAARGQQRRLPATWGPGALHGIALVWSAAEGGAARIRRLGPHLPQSAL